MTQNVRETLSVEDLRLGMFVLDLDRPWLGTPFLLQGFLIDDVAQIVDLKKYCREVTIDRSRSIGQHFQAEGKTNVAVKRIAVKPLENFSIVCRVLRERPPKRRPGQKPPKVTGPDNQSPLEEELLYSAPIIDDVKEKLKSIRTVLDEGRSLNMGEMSGLVSEMAESVERNPDAMIWLTRLRSTDEYTYDHAVDVSVHLMVLSRFLGLPTKTVELLGQAGLMQDIGKINLPEAVLNKTGALTEEELTLMKSHVASSMDILVKQAGFPIEALTIVGSHHERHDGSGYPRRIGGEKIALNAELAGLIDCYCALLRQRPYRSAFSSQQALESLIGMRDSKFRAPLVDQLIQCIGLYPIGTLVELNSGEVGVVIQQNQVRRLRPRIMIVLGPDKTMERRPRTIDLMMSPQTGTGQTYCILHSLPLNAYGINPDDFYLG